VESGVGRAPWTATQEANDNLSTTSVARVSGYIPLALWTWPRSSVLESKFHTVRLAFSRWPDIVQYCITYACTSCSGVTDLYLRVSESVERDFDHLRSRRTEDSVDGMRRSYLNDWYIRQHSCSINSSRCAPRPPVPRTPPISLQIKSTNPSPTRLAPSFRKTTNMVLRLSMSRSVNDRPRQTLVSRKLNGSRASNPIRSAIPGPAKRNSRPWDRRRAQ
jgi:hypothetical protein